MQEQQSGHLRTGHLTEQQFAHYLDTGDLPDPDLLIRTSGECRTSNFLQWQSAYAEIIFTDTLWPDFHKENLLQTLEQYAQRERRFGQTSER